MKTLKIFSLICAFGALSLSAETIDLSKHSEWINIGARAFQNGKIVCQNSASMQSRKHFVIDENKTYTISMDVKRIKEDAKNPLVLFGYEALDANGKVIPVQTYQTVIGSLTEVVADAKKGDTVLRIKDGKKWRRGNDFRIMAGAKEDNSDIPNKNVIAHGIKSIKKEGEVYVVTLSKALLADVAAGTKVREHLAGGYFYVHPSIKINTDNIYRIKAVTKGFNNYGLLDKKVFPRGVPKWRLVVLLNWNRSKAGVEVSNFTFTIE